MSIAAELADFLAAQGVGERGGDEEWSIHVGEEPASPGSVITLYDTGGPGDLNIDAEIAQPTVQVRVRASDYEACYDKHQQIAAELVTELQRMIGGHWYIGIWKTSDVLDIGRDSNKRCRMTANYRTLRQPP